MLIMAWNDAPEDVLLEILDHLPNLTDVRSFALTCKRWNAACLVDYHWRRRFFRRYPAVNAKQLFAMTINVVISLFYIYCIITYQT